MNQYSRLLAFILGCFTVTLLWAKDPAVRYTVSFPDPHTHYATVTMEVTEWDHSSLTIKMPVWTPGSYMIREFPQNVESVTASSAAGTLLPAQKIAKNAWLIDNGKEQSISITYQVYANEYTVRTSHIDADHATLNLASVLMYIDDHVTLPGTITFAPAAGWKTITTTLPQQGSPWVRTFADFDELADSPVEIGNHRTFAFEAAGVPHTVAMIGIDRYPEAMLREDISKIVETCTAVFGDHPSREYIFFIHHTASGGGGLEHANSTSVIVQRDAYLRTDAYEGFMSLLVHEYFHLWNVKRLRPHPLGPFNYEAENYTTLLWQSEGFTSYYDEYLLLRAGYINEESYLRKLAGAINSITNSPGSLVQPVAEASMDAWIKFYRRNENSPNATVSYYTKGNIIAAALDLTIIHHSRGKYQLDDVLQAMYDEYYLRKNKAFQEEDLQRALEKAAGIALDAFFRKYIHGTEPLPWETLLGYAGLEITDTRAGERQARIGAVLGAASGNLVVQLVERSSAAWEGGLNTDDEVLAVNGIRATADNWAMLEALAQPGDRWEVLISRDGLLRTITCTLKIDTKVQYRIRKSQDASKRQQEVYEKWLGYPY